MYMCVVMNTESIYLINASAGIVDVWEIERRIFVCDHTDSTVLVVVGDSI